MPTEKTKWMYLNGSTYWFNNNNAYITQYDAYLPYGELLVDEHSSSEGMPYKFNGKEMDEETGLYYYGARYMNPVTSLWYGVDQMTEKFENASAYTYCNDNPVISVDPDGNKKVVVTGGADVHNNVRMNFVNASEIQLSKYLNRAESFEEIKWLIFDIGYTPKEKASIKEWAHDHGVFYKFVPLQEVQVIGKKKETETGTKE